MIYFRRVDIRSVNGARSLCWIGEDLVDWAGGGVRYHMDGTSEPSRFFYAYKFDAAVAAPSGRFSVLYTRLGTKGLVLDADGRAVREVDRSYYHAHVYEYPVAFFALPDGRDVLAHCPREYNQIEFELADTGEPLTNRHERHPDDCFHSRLATNPSGTRLLSAGWVWHPFDVVALYDVGPCLADPTRLDDVSDLPLSVDAEISAAAFADDDTLVVASATDGETFETAEPDAPALRPGMVAVLDLAAGSTRSLAQLEETAGTLLPVGGGQVVGFFDHPKVIDLATGRVVHRWPDLKTGRQLSSIIHHVGPLPPLALDPVRRRFAVASDKTVTVISLTP
jgi:hypothetical protein